MRSWFTTEVVNHQVVRALNVVIPTRGCSWNRCYMCSYSLESEEREFLSDFRGLMKNEFGKVKIFTSGSFLDKREVPTSLRNELVSILREKEVEEVAIETRPEYVKEALEVQSLLGDINLEVALGLESSNDRVLKFCINKGFTFNDFVKAATILEGIKVKVYILVKPPFLTEYEAVEDAVKSARDVKDYADVISFNPVVIHTRTVLEYLWRAKEYTPPWLWSVVEVLNRTRNLNPHIMCHPVAVGRYRGVRNCRKCTFKVAEKIQEYSIKNEEIVLDCECKEKWKEEMERLQA